MKKRKASRSYPLHLKRVTTPEEEQIFFKELHPDFHRYRMKKRQRRIDNYFTIGAVLSVMLILVFCFLLLTQEPVPDYLIGFVGSILSYFLLVKPFEERR